MNFFSIQLELVFRFIIRTVVLLITNESNQNKNETLIVNRVIDIWAKEKHAT